MCCVVYVCVSESFGRCADGGSWWWFLNAHTLFDFVSRLKYYIMETLSLNGAFRVYHYHHFHTPFSAPRTVPAPFLLFHRHRCETLPLTIQCKSSHSFYAMNNNSLTFHLLEVYFIYIYYTQVFGVHFRDRRRQQGDTIGMSNVYVSSFI